jgi:hypothetical protein
MHSGTSATQIVRLRQAGSNVEDECKKVKMGITE